MCGQNICHHYFATLRDSNKFDMRGWRRETSVSPPVKYFTDRSKKVHICLFCLVFVVPLCASVYLCLVVTSLERADLLVLVCGV